MDHWRIKNRKNIIFKNLKTTPKMIIQLREHWRIKNRKNIIFKNLKTTPNIENWNIGILEYLNIEIFIK